MALALYAPGLGYYAHARPKFGALPCSGSDFVTAPELSPLFGQALARAAARRRWRPAAPTSAGVRRRLGRAGRAAARRAGRRACGATRIVDLSARCARASAQRWRAFGDRVRWLDALPERDRRRGGRQRGARRDAGAAAALRRRALARARRGARRRRRASRGATGRRALRPPHDGRSSPGTVDRDPSAGARPSSRTLAERAARAARRSSSTTAFPRPSTTTRSARGGTLMCHRAPPRRHRPAGATSAPRTSPRTSTSRGIALAGAGRRARRARLHLAGALPDQLRPARR